LEDPFYRTAQELAKVMKITTPPLDVIWSALKNAGYNVSSTHCHAGSFKTDAPQSFIWDMMKTWVLLPKPTKISNFRLNSTQLDRKDWLPNPMLHFPGYSQFR